MEEEEHQDEEKPMNAAIAKEEDQTAELKDEEKPRIFSLRMNSMHRQMEKSRLIQKAASERVVVKEAGGIETLKDSEEEMDTEGLFENLFNGGHNAKKFNTPNSKNPTAKISNTPNTRNPTEMIKKMTKYDVRKLLEKWLVGDQFEEDRVQLEDLWLTGSDLVNDLFGQGISKYAVSVFSVAAKKMLRAKFQNWNGFEEEMKDGDLSEGTSRQNVPVVVHGDGNHLEEEDEPMELDAGRIEGDHDTRNREDDNIENPEEESLVDAEEYGKAVENLYNMEIEDPELPEHEEEPVEEDKDTAPQLQEVGNQQLSTSNSDRNGNVFKVPKNPGNEIGNNERLSTPTPRQHFEKYRLLEQLKVAILRWNRTEVFALCYDVLAKKHPDDYEMVKKSGQFDGMKLGMCVFNNPSDGEVFSAGAKQDLQDYLKANYLKS